jgi:hypothetical protein
MSAKSSGAATFDRSVRLQLLIAENGLEALEKLPALATDDVGHFEGRPRHGRRCLPRDNQFTPAEKLIESQSCSVRGACGFVLTG